MATSARPIERQNGDKMGSKRGRNGDETGRDRAIKLQQSVFVCVCVCVCVLGSYCDPSAFLTMGDLGVTYRGEEVE